jgi:uridine kinase
MKKPYLIGITGGSGSGKTTFIKELRNRCSESQLCIISQDEYYKDREDQVEDLEGIKNFDLPSSIDNKAFILDIKKLRRGEAVSRKEYTFNNKKKEASIIEYKPAKVIIVEGLFVFYNPQIKRMLDLKIFIQAKENLKVIRRIKRDRIERNYPLDDVLYRYENHVMPTYQKYIEPFLADADLVVNNNASFDKGLDVVTAFINSQI